jgi:hypothetical protein
MSTAISTFWVDAHGNLLFPGRQLDGDLYHWTEEGGLAVRREGQRSDVEIGVADVPWPTLVALGAVKNAFNYKDVVRIDRKPGALSVAFWDGKQKEAWFEELLPPGFAERLPDEDDEDRFGAEGEDLAWAMYDEALSWVASLLYDRPR